MELVGDHDRIGQRTTEARPGQHKIRWIAYILVGMLVVRALFDLFNGEIGRGVGMFIAAAVIFGCQRLLEP
ncbi:hypothetical protein [Cryobacterium sp. LW097]|uniref:hypothetical protein n=1 Tax=Cryobacterium sp. LW097 TaxID=1978566 RepID=UPI00197AAC3F|nr:hypothetical protein [Cryobacterium sp. LW097]